MPDYRGGWQRSRGILFLSQNASASSRPSRALRCSGVSPGGPTQGSPLGARAGRPVAGSTAPWPGVPAGGWPGVPAGGWPGVPAAGCVRPPGGAAGADEDGRSRSPRRPGSSRSRRSSRPSRPPSPRSPCGRSPRGPSPCGRSPRSFLSSDRTSAVDRSGLTVGTTADGADSAAGAGVPRSGPGATRVPGGSAATGGRPVSEAAPAGVSCGTGDRSSGELSNCATLNTPRPTTMTAATAASSRRFDSIDRSTSQTRPE